MDNLDFFENENLDGIRLLNQTIESFNGAAFKFETYYRHLEERVRELDLELEEKNRELKKNLQEKEEVKNYLRNILESLTTGVVVVDLKGMVTTFNRAAEKITGLNSENVRGKRFNELFISSLFPKLNRKAGSPAEIGQSMEIETEILQRGKDILHVSLSTFPVKDQRGEKIGTALTLQDITRLKKLEEKANRTDKLAAMGEMAAEIAHEIRNPLGSIELFATTLKKDLEGFGDLQNLADHISSGVRNMNSSISNLLLFIRPHQKFEFQITDINSTLDDSLLFSRELFVSNSSIEVVTRYSKEPLEVNGDPELLKQVCLNLVLNAVQAMPDGGRLTVSTNKLNGRQRDSSLVEIRICDTGNGVSRQDMSKIFDPFFTTKNKGTGLGLAIVHNILEIHGGDIDIESLEEEGTVCRVTLPLCEGENGK
ncbi:MAG: PAS domain S-box protein [Deltaproteobacteria bacterium]|nr:PAS domain S-box protein [Deltaproteobacteria bacterium]